MRIENLFRDRVHLDNDDDEEEGGVTFGHFVCYTQKGSTSPKLEHLVQSIIVIYFALA